LFFARDLAGSAIPMHHDAMVTCGGHVGGLLGGMLLALIFRRPRADQGEVRAADPAGRTPVNPEASRRCRGIPDPAPHDRTVRHRFLKNSRGDAAREGAGFNNFVRAMAISDFPAAVQTVREYYPRHVQGLSGEILFRIGVAFFQDADFERARRCLELAAGRPGAWQTRARLLLGRAYEMLGETVMAARVFEDLLARAPEEIFRRQAARRLAALKRTDAGLCAPDAMRA
jgi:hypothetical protein